MRGTQGGVTYVYCSAGGRAETTGCVRTTSAAEITSGRGFLDVEEEIL